MIMKNEIKEINIKMPGQILDYVDTKEHLLEFFNYITNLQQIEQDHQKLNGELREELEDYKSRNEKAIEYIKQHTEQRIYQEPYNIDGFPDRVEYFIEGKWNLLGILQGDDKDGQ